MPKIEVEVTYVAKYKKTLEVDAASLELIRGMGSNDECAEYLHDIYLKKSLPEDYCVLDAFTVLPEEANNAGEAST